MLYSYFIFSAFIPNSVCCLDFIIVFEVVVLLGVLISWLVSSYPLVAPASHLMTCPLDSSHQAWGAWKGRSEGKVPEARWPLPVFQNSPPDGSHRFSWTLLGI